MSIKIPESSSAALLSRLVQQTGATPPPPAAAPVAAERVARTVADAFSGAGNNAASSPRLTGQELASNLAATALGNVQSDMTKIGQLSQAQKLLGGLFQALESAGGGQNKYVQELAGKVGQAFQGWQQQLGSLKQDVAQNFAVAAEAGALSGNPTFQNLVGGLQQAQQSWGSALPKGGMDGMYYRSLQQQVAPQFQPAALQQGFVSAAQNGGAGQLVEDLGFNSGESQVADPAYAGGVDEGGAVAEGGVDEGGAVDGGATEDVNPRQRPLAGPTASYNANTKQWAVNVPLAQKDTYKENAAYTKEFGSGNFQGDLSLGQTSLSTSQHASLDPKNLTVSAGGNFDARASAANVRGSWGTSDGTLAAQGSVALGEAVVQGGGNVTADLKNLKLGVDANAKVGLYAIDAQGSVTEKDPIGTTRASGNATVGADVEGNANVSVDPLHGTLEAKVGGEAFAGVKAGGEITRTVGPVGVTAGGQVEAGIGAKFNVDAGFQDGKLHAKFDIGAALGIGAELKFGVNIDFKKLANEIKDFVKNPIKGVGDLVKKGVEGVEWLGKTGLNVVKGVAKGVEKVGEKVVEGAKKVGEGIKNVAEKVGDGIKNVAEKVGDGFKKVFSGW